MSEHAVRRKSWKRPTLHTFGSLEGLTGSGGGKPPGLFWGPFKPWKPWKPKGPYHWKPWPDPCEDTLSGL